MARAAQRALRIIVVPPFRANSLRTESVPGRRLVVPRSPLLAPLDTGGLEKFGAPRLQGECRALNQGSDDTVECSAFLPIDVRDADEPEWLESWLTLPFDGAPALVRF
jgi:hypothetical protein